jgi:uncharacterized DUF497 family protein
MFTFDFKKAITNYSKHGVSFEEAVTVFLDPEGLDWKDELQSINEDRRKRLGSSDKNRISLVVYTLREESNGIEETTRIISARPANRKERGAYSR